MVIRMLLTALVMLAVFQKETAAQQTGGGESLPIGKNLGISSAYAPTSFKGWGKVRNTRQFYLDVHLSHTSIPAGNTVIRLGSGLIVAGWIHFPSNGFHGPRETRTALGMVPLSVHIPVTRHSHFPFFTTSAGFIVTDTRFPNRHGSRLNYLLDAGIGYHIPLPGNHAVQAGYKLHHLSNGNRSTENPGIDSHMFFIRLLFGL